MANVLQNEMRSTARRVVVLLTCHNRREETLACLHRLAAQERTADVQIDVILVDDGSSDGTAEAVHAAFPAVTVLKGDGSLFWNGGMRLAFARALARGYDYYLWLNDDTRLHSGALTRLLSAHEEALRTDGRPAVIVGSTCDAESGALTYGGVRRSSRWHPLRYALVPPGPVSLACDAMNGNCVLIPHAVAQQVGNLDPRFTHGIGDYDYAQRVRRAGFRVLVAPGFVGTCSRNSPGGGWQDTRLPLRVRWAKMRGPKGLPPRDWMAYARRYAGALWPVYGSLPVLRLVWTAAKARLAPRTATNA